MPTAGGAAVGVANAEAELLGAALGRKVGEGDGLGCAAVGVPLLLLWKRK
jgi:hypothetical protein